ncbi:hypothetical protein HD554DRAFT_2034486 [Boletus coccyginus]|nr:hypothetical protein HD554DRAFT_2034486 [Boletus coccyginus]
MPLCHYKGGMTLDILCFDEVCTDNPLVTSPNYMDVPLEALSDVREGDFWWEALPPGVSLRILKEPRLPIFNDTPTEERFQWFQICLESNGKKKKAVAINHKLPVAVVVAENMGNAEARPSTCISLKRKGKEDISI